MFTEKELKYLKNIVIILNKAKFDIEGSEIMQIATSMTVLQSSIIPKVEQALIKPESLKISESLVKEPKKRIRKSKVSE